MATNTNAVTLSSHDAEQVRKCIQDAQDHIHSAQGEIHHAQGCLNEINNLLRPRSVSEAASGLASPNSNIKVAQKHSAIMPQAHGIKTTRATHEAHGAVSQFASAEAERSTSVSNNTDQAQTGKNYPTRKARYSTAPMTEKENAFLRTQIGYTKKTRVASYFLQPVNPVALGLPTYSVIIKQPMDLSTVESKLKTNEYSSIQACVDDLQLIVDNAREFNGAEHAITHAAYSMLGYVHERIETMAQPVQRRKRKGSLED